ncbi:hypothetical protein ACHAXA_006358 [Cyclostephanos tholiformis]|uniref:Aldehyde dehydrogenase domain-containing protein n=1 Tax=Cyclostephanos tholiformis TaxID=382380 RepID=A0ABD3RBI3_9STRA
MILRSTAPLHPSSAARGGGIIDTVAASLSSSSSSPWRVVSSIVLASSSSSSSPPSPPSFHPHRSPSYPPVGETNTTTRVYHRASSSIGGGKMSPTGDDVPWLHRDAVDGDRVGVPRFKNFVNGSHISPTCSVVVAPPSSSPDDDIPVIDPSTNEILSYVPNDSSSSSSAVNDAVIAAKNAYPEWSNTPVQVRQRLLAEYSNLLHKREIREEVA